MPHTAKPIELFPITSPPLPHLQPCTLARTHSSSGFLASSVACSLAASSLQCHVFNCLTVVNSVSFVAPLIHFNRLCLQFRLLIDSSASQSPNLVASPSANIPPIPNTSHFSTIRFARRETGQYQRPRAYTLCWCLLTPRGFVQGTAVLPLVQSWLCACCLLRVQLRLLSTISFIK